METVECVPIRQRFASVKTLCSLYDIGATRCRSLIRKMRATKKFRRDVVSAGGKTWARLDSFESVFLEQDLRHGS